ncbi:MAG: LLM class F420-dependent oxidoreductase [Actinobacteria bacterium]|nr:LLM class F420-dependent oxidoreductase [Actinomycetota bacterium]
MHFGIVFANAGPFADPVTGVACARAAEAAGFESLWTVEHVLVPAGYESEYPYDKSGKMPGGESSDIPDPLIWLAYVAAATERIKLGTGILILPQRNPAVTAKEVATLDKLSGGRVLLGVGAGWLREEFDALDVPFEDRGRRLDAYIRAMRALWEQDEATVDEPGFVHLERAVSLPKPPSGRVPVHIGGHSEAAARRAGRLGDGFFPGKGDHDRLRDLIAIARRTADENGRDPDAVEVTAGAGPGLGDDPMGELERLRDLGVSRVVVPPQAFDAASAPAAYEAFADRVLRPWADRG